MNLVKTLILSLCFLAYSNNLAAEEAEEYPFSQAELDQILAPIALYPDTVLSHILIASTYPLEVVQANRWAKKNKTLDANEALKAVEPQDWDPSIKALIALPNLLDKMNKDLDWTQRLGDVFLQDEELVLASIQNLRAHAYAEGNLDDLEHLEVTRENDDIIIESRTREVVYVPYYDSRVVYGPWWWIDYPPLYWTHQSHHHYSGAHIYWGPQIFVGSGIYFSSFHWSKRYVVVINHHRNHYGIQSGRQIVRHADSRHWSHDQRHRRSVRYSHAYISRRNNNHSQLPNRHTSEGYKRSDRLDANTLSERLNRHTPSDNHTYNHNQSKTASDSAPQSHSRSTTGRQSSESNAATRQLRTISHEENGKRDSNINRNSRGNENTVSRENNRIHTNSTDSTTANRSEASTIILNRASGSMPNSEIQTSTRSPGSLRNSDSSSRSSSRFSSRSSSHLNSDKYNYTKRSSSRKLSASKKSHKNFRRN
ncbi:MAG: hypothetical protein ACI9Y1_001601 [Lentisphaeria bacterium]|jgi:hypothetical protein